MIYCLNNDCNFNDRYDLTYRETMTFNTYVPQNPDKTNTVVHLKFKDEAMQQLQQRLNINKKNFPNFTGTNSYIDWFFKIVRYDSEFPYFAILVDKENRVIVTSTSKLESLFTHSGYKYRIYDGYYELEMEVIEDWDEFNLRYKDDYVHSYPIQKRALLGMPVYVEFYKDLFTLEPQMQFPEIDFSDRHITPEEIRQLIISKDPELDAFDNSVLIRYPRYYNKHLKDMQDMPLRVVTRGTVIRIDESCADPHIVVMTDSDISGTRFITDKEATFYYNDESIPNNWEAIYLWQK